MRPLMRKGFVLFFVQRYRISSFQWDRGVYLTILQRGFANKQGEEEGKCVSVSMIWEINKDVLDVLFPLRG